VSDDAIVAEPVGPYVDLHAHTTASDGLASPEELVAVALAADLGAIAVTDHDTVAGVAAATSAAVGTPLEVIAGVELSCGDERREVHLLGLCLGDLAPMHEALGAARAAREVRGAEMVDRLNRLGIPVTHEMVAAEAGIGNVGRPHVARALVAGGWVPTVREAFDRYLGDGRPACVDRPKLSLADAIALVHRAGGVALWAHPGSEGTREKVARYVALGLDGLEVRHPSHPSPDVERLARFCDEFDLVRSGGSDWHGEPATWKPLGCMHVPLPWLDALRERAATHVA
jgi:hypothetical protein